MYDTVEQLRAMIARQKMAAPMIAKRYGTHYAELQLTELHGARTSSSPHGHFGFFEYDSFDAEKCVNKVGPL
jgi:hypothetical protein